MEFKNNKILAKSIQKRWSRKFFRSITINVAKTWSQFVYISLLCIHARIPPLNYRLGLVGNTENQKIYKRTDTLSGRRLNVYPNNIKRIFGLFVSYVFSTRKKFRKKVTIEKCGCFS